MNKKRNSLVGLGLIPIFLSGCDEFAFSYSERAPRREVVFVEPPPPEVTVIEHRPVREVHIVDPRPVTEVHVHHPRPVTEVHVVKPSPKHVHVAPAAPGPGYVWNGKRWVKATHKGKAKPDHPQNPPKKYSSGD